MSRLGTDQCQLAMQLCRIDRPTAETVDWIRNVHFRLAVTTAHLQLMDQSELNFHDADVHFLARGQRGLCVSTE